MNKCGMFQMLAKSLNDMLDRGENVNMRDVHPKILYHMHNQPGQVKEAGGQEYRVAPHGSWVRIDG